jgi:hypothetical protein
MDISTQTAPRARFHAAHDSLRSLLVEMSDAYNLKRIDGVAKSLADYADEALELRTASETFEDTFTKLVRLWN